MSYDIANTDSAFGSRRLRDIAAVCSSFGHRVQLSVFECRVSPAALAMLEAAILDVIDPRIDSVMIYRFAGSVAECRTNLGRGAPREVDEPWII